MKFSIIIPCNKENNIQDLLDSLIRQTYGNWEAIVVDQPSNKKNILEEIVPFEDPRLRYVQADLPGVHASNNRALEELSIESEWVIFLNQTSKLSPDTLSFLRETLLANNQTIEWVVTNYALQDGTPLTRGKDGEMYSYCIDHLIRNRLQGVGLHTIKTKIIKTLRFPRRLKKEGSWLFFFRLSKKRKFLYLDHNSAIRCKTFSAKYVVTEEFFEEIMVQGLWKDPLFLITCIILRLFPKQTDF